jgi:hypothetical protein
MSQQELFRGSSSSEEQFPDNEEAHYRPRSRSTWPGAALKDEPPASYDESMIQGNYQEQLQPFRTYSETGYGSQRSETGQAQRHWNGHGRFSWIVLRIWMMLIAGSLVGLLVLLHPQLYVLIRILQVAGIMVLTFAYPFLVAAVLSLPWFLVMVTGRFIVKRRGLPMPAWLEWPRAWGKHYRGSCSRNREHA